MSSAGSSIIAFFKDRFNLSRDQEKEEQIVAEIRQSVEFRGINVWVLVFAIMVASVGLNVNATAVIIGAMLISPLMGPIMGVGLGIGISDVILIKKAAKNLGVMVAISVATSSIYFLVSPLREAQSELLNRTTPTIYDVFIALFGGLAGIVATSSRERGNVIPGVAIATALMPPLCTAGYGIATGSLKYFAGAFYLFSINAVFICFSTLLIVRFLRFREVAFLSQQARKRVQTIIGIFVVLMIIPSIYIARNLVLKSIFETRANEFIKNEFHFSTTEVIKHEVVFAPEKEIEISLMGTPLDANTISNIEHQMPQYKLGDARLVVKQNEKGLDAEAIKSQVLETYLERNLDSLKSKDEKINYLTKELMKWQQQHQPIDKLTREVCVFDKNIKQFSVRPITTYNDQGKAIDTFQLALAKYAAPPKPEEIKRFTDWLKLRLETDSVKVVVE
jgi:uncharacterized hydrophobic protein (TIGR00271 family)